MIGEKKNILGNLNHKSFKEIWLSKKSKEARDMLNNANRSLSPCNICDVKGTLIGERHSNAWKKLG